MKPQEFISTLQGYIDAANQLIKDGSSESQDWEMLIDDLNDTFRFVEIEEQWFGTVVFISSRYKIKNYE